MAKHKYIDSPELLWQYWIEYKNSLDPVKVPTVHPKFGTIDIELKQPVHQRGFNVFMMEHYDLGDKTIHKYFENESNAYDEYRGTISRIKDDIFQHNYLYASIGLHKEKLTMSLLGMAEKNETTLKAETPIFTGIDLNVPENNSPIEDSTTP